MIEFKFTRYDFTDCFKFWKLVEILSHFLLDGIGREDISK